jgi:hypothetical protein
VLENNISDIYNNDNVQNTSAQDEVDKFINSTSKYVNLPKRDGKSSVYQFFKDKTKRKLVTKTFTDPITHQPKTPQTRVGIQCNRSKSDRSGRKATGCIKDFGTND